MIGGSTVQTTLVASKAVTVQTTARLYQPLLSGALSGVKATSGGVASILIRTVALAVLPAESVAVQTTVCVPSPETVRVALATGVPIPNSPLKVAPVQLIDVTFDESSLAVTVPVTDALLNQSLKPSGDGNETDTEGGVVSTTARAGANTYWSSVMDSRLMARTLRSIDVAFFFIFTAI